MGMIGPRRRQRIDGGLQRAPFGSNARAASQSKSIAFGTPTVAPEVVVADQLGSPDFLTAKIALDPVSSTTATAAMGTRIEAPPSIRRKEGALFRLASQSRWSAVCFVYGRFVCSRLVPLSLCGLVIWYSVHCHVCGLLITTSRLSVRAARADAQLNCSANQGPHGDKCVACRKAETRRQTEEMLARGPIASHSAGPCGGGH